MLKRHSLAFHLSLLSCFFCLDSLFWHGLASLNLVISTEHHSSAQIDFDMHKFKLFLFSHALRYHHVFGIKWKKRKMLLIPKYIVWLNLTWQWRYLTDKTGFLFIGTHCTVKTLYNEILGTWELCSLHKVFVVSVINTNTKQGNWLHWNQNKNVISGIPSDLYTDCPPQIEKKKKKLQSDFQHQ